jgi:cytochrome c oxidase subunit 2
MQEIAWYLTVVIIALIALVFIWVVQQSGRREEYGLVQGNAYRARFYIFIGLIVAGIAIAAVTLRDLPYVAAGASSPSQIVTAKGFQWYWEVNRKSVVAGEPVEFQITSADVNHGVGIYDDQLRLVAQAQAMPGYVNRLRHTFTKPGKYRLLCLEYCGLAHHDMTGVLEVKAR